VAHQVVLQQLHFFGWQRNAHVAADTGVDAVDALAARHQLIQAEATLGDATERRRRDFHLSAFPRHAHGVFDGQAGRANFECLCHVR
jgi:hypothetical protein